MVPPGCSSHDFLSGLFDSLNKDVTVKSLIVLSVAGCACEVEEEDYPVSDVTVFAGVT